VSFISDSTVQPGRFIGLAKDYTALAKPRLSSVVFFTALSGLAIAPGETLGVVNSIVFLFATALIIGSANAINCYLERNQDALMERTEMRPLAAGRVQPEIALVVWSAFGCLAALLLLLSTNLLTMLLGVLALVLYVGVYTPLKYVSPLALYIGAIPGAIPPLMGCTAVTNSLNSEGLILFALMLVWQIPHFLAISVYLKQDYEKAGIKMYATHYEFSRIQRWIILTSILVGLVSLLPVLFGMTSWFYAIFALVVGLWLVLRAMEKQESDPAIWSRRYFLATVIYIPLVFGALVVGVY